MYALVPVRAHVPAQLQHTSCVVAAANVFSSRASSSSLRCGGAACSSRRAPPLPVRPLGLLRPGRHRLGFCERRRFFACLRRLEEILSEVVDWPAGRP